MDGEKRISLIACVAVGFAVAAGTATAQPPGRGGLSRMDANGDGVLQQDEIPSAAKPAFRRIAQRAGLDPNGPIPLDRLTGQPGQGGREESRDGQEQGTDRGDDRRGNEGDRRRGEQRGRDDDDRRRRERDDENRPERRPDALPIRVTGFAFELPFPKVPGFDVPLSVTRQEGPTVAELVQQHDGRTIAFARRLLERADENGNQIVDPGEWGRLRWRGDPNELDLNRDARLTLAELIQGIARQRRDREGNEPDRPEGGSNEENASNGDQAASDKVAEYAHKLIRDNDRNNNGVIDRDERRGLRGDPARADANGDGTITEEELVARMRGSSDAARRATEARRRAIEARRSANRPDDGRNRSVERAPAWFRSRDKDGDGQVAMSEYTSNWDAAKVAEFAARDTNGDGVIALSEATR